MELSKSPLYFLCTFAGDHHEDLLVAGQLGVSTIEEVFDMKTSTSGYLPPYSATILRSILTVISFGPHLIEGAAGKIINSSNTIETTRSIQ